MPCSLNSFLLPNAYQAEFSTVSWCSNCCFWRFVSSSNWRRFSSFVFSCSDISCKSIFFASNSSVRWSTFLLSSSKRSVSILIVFCSSLIWNVLFCACSLSFWSSFLLSSSNCPRLFRSSFISCISEAVRSSDAFFMVRICSFCLISSMVVCISLMAFRYMFISCSTSACIILSESLTSLAASKSFLSTMGPHDVKRRRLVKKANVILFIICYLLYSFSPIIFQIVLFFQQKINISGLTAHVSIYCK